jgi:hypothetical protein
MTLTAVISRAPLLDDASTVMGETISVELLESSGVPGDRERVVHRGDWQASSDDGADHMCEEIEASCRRLGIEEIDLEHLG